MNGAEGARHARRTSPALALLALLSTGLVAYALAPWGIGANQYGLHQIAAAECFRAGEPWVMTRGGSYAIWPPLYPVLLAAGRALGATYAATALAIQLAAHAVSLWLAGRLLRTLFASDGVALAGVALLVASPEVLAAPLLVRNEPAFVALVLASALALARWLERPTMARLAALVAASALACLQHYKGVAVVLPFSLLMLCWPASLAPRRRAASAAAYAGLALLPLSFWIARNLRLEGEWSGARIPGGVPFSTIHGQLAGTVSRWLAPGAPEAVVDALTVAAALLALALVPRFLVDARERRALLLYLAFPLTYVAALVRWALSTSLDALDTRLLMAVQPFFLGLLALGARASLAGGAVTSRIPRTLRAGLVLSFFAVHLAFVLPDTAALVADTRARGAGGFASPAWQRSQLAAWLARNELDGEVHGNFPEAVLFFADRRAALVDEHTLELAGPGSHVVWVAGFRGALAPPPPPLGRRLVEVARFADGGVWRVEAAR